jgi:uncharacterized membrane protein YesL
VATEAGNPPRLDRAAVWHHTPLLVVMNAALALALLPALLVLLGGAVLAAPFVAALTLGPAWAATVSVTDRIVVDEPVSVAVFGRMLRRHAGEGVRTAAVPAVACASVMTSSSLMGEPPVAWLWTACMLVALAAAVGVVLALPFAFSLATTAGLRGGRVWLTALLVAGFRPARTLATFALVGFVGALAYLLGPGLVLVAPSLIALRCSMAVPFELPKDC